MFHASAFVSIGVILYVAVRQLHPWQSTWGTKTITRRCRVWSSNLD